MTFQGIRSHISPAVELDPPTEWITAGSFERDGRRIVLLANVGPTAYAGTAKTGNKRKWSKWFLETGTVEQANGSVAAVPIALPPRSSVLLIEE